MVYKIIFLLLALLLGSFANVLIYRIPLKLSLWFPGSMCPHCKHKLAWYENIPLLSYFFLGAKCSNCKTKIHMQYPLVELALALASIPLMNIAIERIKAISRLDNDIWTLAGDHLIIFGDYIFYLVLFSLVVALAVIDQRLQILPVVLSYAGIILIALYVSVFSSPYYEISHNFAGFLPASLLAFFSMLKQLGVIFIVCDAAVHLFNRAMFKKDKAEPVVSMALTFGNNLLAKYMTLIYLLVLLLITLALYFNQMIFLDYFFTLIGFLYFTNEVVLYFFNLKKTSEHNLADETLPVRSTVLGGGDVAMLAMIAALLGFKKALIVLLTSFYIAFIFVLVKMILGFVQWQRRQSMQDNSSFDFKAYLTGKHSLGPALAIAFIAGIMILS